jgi:hypothetical protein
MDEREFIREIARAWHLLKDELALGRFFVTPISLPVDEVFRDLALSEEASYADIYRLGLSRSHYNIMLNDYAYFQFSYVSSSAWRLAYLSNPWVTGVPLALARQQYWENLEEVGAISHEDVAEFLADQPFILSVPPVRFDYAPQQYRELVHPAAHFHIGRYDENRWPSALVLGPIAFTLMIAKLYYADAWEPRSALTGEHVERCVDETLLFEVARLRAVHDFSERERSGLHIGKNMRAAA